MAIPTAQTATSGKAAAGTPLFPDHKCLPPLRIEWGHKWAHVMPCPSIVRAYFSECRASAPDTSESSRELVLTPGRPRTARPPGDFHPPLSIHHCCFTALGEGQWHLQQPSRRGQAEDKTDPIQRHDPGTLYSHHWFCQCPPSRAQFRESRG